MNTDFDLTGVDAWDIYERVPFGAFGERRHKLLLTADYTTSDGGVNDLVAILKVYADKPSTIHIKPLVYVK